MSQGKRNVTRNLRLTIIGLLGILLTISFLDSKKSIAGQGLVRVITDANRIVNFLDFNSVKNKG